MVEIILINRQEAVDFFTKKNLTSVLEETNDLHKDDLGLVLKHEADVRRQIMHHTLKETVLESVYQKRNPLEAIDTRFQSTKTLEDRHARRSSTVYSYSFGPAALLSKVPEITMGAGATRTKGRRGALSLTLPSFDRGVANSIASSSAQPLHHQNKGSHKGADAAAVYNIPSPLVSSRSTPILPSETTSM